MDNVQNFLERVKGNFSNVQKKVFLSVIFVGLITHIYVLTNNYLYHDSAAFIFKVGGTFRSGRWMLGGIYSVLQNTIGAFQLPVVNGFLSILFIGLSGIIIVRLFDIKSSVIAVLIGGIMVTFPTVAATFSYMYTAPYYFLALFLSVLGIYILIKKSNIVGLLLGASIIAMSMGIYQAYFAVSAVVAAMHVMLKLFEGRKKTSDILWLGIHSVVGLVFGIVEYFALNKIILHAMKLELRDYQGISSMGDISFGEWLALIPKAYSEFSHCGWQGMNGNAYMRGMTYCVICITVAIALLNFLRRGRKVVNTILFFLVLLLMPIAFNLVYLFSTDPTYNVHCLMLYSLAFTFIFPFVLCDKWMDDEKDYRLVKLLRKLFNVILTLAIFLQIIGYVVTDNAAYLRMSIVQEQATSWFTTLVSEIKGTEGYKDEMGIVYIGERNIKDKTLSNIEFNLGEFTGYDMSEQELLNNYVWRKYMYLHTGYSPCRIGDATLFENREDVKKMPCYPDKGAIKVIGKTVVVKFGEP